MKALTFAGLGLAALLAGAGFASAKTLVYCSEGSPENFTPAINTTGTSFDAARPGLQSPDRIQARHDRGRSRPRRKLGHHRRRQDDHLPSAQGRQVPFVEGLQADARFQRRRRAVLDQPAVEARQSLLQGLRRQVRLFQRHGHAEAARFGREDGRLHRRHEAQDAERRHPRQSGDGLHGDRLEPNTPTSCSRRERPSSSTRRRSAPARSRSSPTRRIPSSATRRTRTITARSRWSTTSSSPSRPTRRRATPSSRRANATSTPIRGRPISRRWRRIHPQGDQHAGPQRRLLGVQRDQAAVRQEGGSSGACRWRSIATRSSRTSISARARRRRR